MMMPFGLPAARQQVGALANQNADPYAWLNPQMIGGIGMLASALSGESPMQGFQILQQSMMDLHNRKRYEKASEREDKLFARQDKQFEREEAKAQAETKKLAEYAKVVPTLFDEMGRFRPEKAGVAAALDPEGAIKMAQRSAMTPQEFPMDYREFQLTQQNPEYAAYQAAQNAPTQYQSQMLDLQRQRLAQAGQPQEMNPYQQATLELQRQRLAQSQQPAFSQTVQLTPEEVVKRGFTPGTVVEQNKRTGASKTLYTPSIEERERISEAAEERKQLALDNSQLVDEAKRMFVDAVASGKMTTKEADARLVKLQRELGVK